MGLSAFVSGLRKKREHQEMCRRMGRKPSVLYQFPLVQVVAADVQYRQNRGTRRRREALHSPISLRSTYTNEGVDETMESFVQLANETAGDSKDAVANRKRWAGLLSEFISKHQGDTQQNQYSLKDKNLVIPAIVKEILDSTTQAKPDWEYIKLHLSTLKILTREMRGLDALLTTKTVEALMSVFKVAPESKKVLEATEQAYALTVNMFVVDRLKTNKLMEDAAVNVSFLIRNLIYHAKSKQLRAHYCLMRILFYLVLVKSVSSKLQPSDKSSCLYTMLSEQLLQSLSPSSVMEDGSEDKKMLLRPVDNINAALCCNEQLDDSDAVHGNPADIVQSELHLPGYPLAGCCAVRYLSERFSEILAMGAAEDPFGDLAKEKDFEEEAAPILAIAQKAESNNEVSDDGVKIERSVLKIVFDDCESPAFGTMMEKEFALVVDPELVSEVKSILEAERKKIEERKKGKTTQASSKTRKLTKEDEREWDEAMKRVEKGTSIKKEGKKREMPKQPRPLDDLKDIKLHIVKMFIVSGVFEGLCQVLDVQAKINPTNPRTHLLPILTALLKLCKKSAAARWHMKRFIFGKDASKETSTYTSSSSSSKKKKNMEPPPYVNLNFWESLFAAAYGDDKFYQDIEEYGRRVGSSIHSYKSAEYIRLCGFGSAAGLLAEKGLPGFENISQRAISLDDLAAEHAKKKRAGK
eukprot:jgi/Bigna1/71855/fgenesh1_pg.17_\